MRRGQGRHRVLGSRTKPTAMAPIRKGSIRVLGMTQRAESENAPQER